MNRLLPIVLLAGLGCLRPSRPVVFHTLQAVALRGAGPGPALEIMPVRIPGALQRPQLVTTLGPGAVGFASGHRWGDLLENEIQRVLVEDLARLLATGRVVAAPYGPRVDAAYRVEVDILRCDGRPGGTLAFTATWMLTRPREDRAQALGRTTLEEPVRGEDPEALVAAHDRVLAALCGEIAAKVRSLP